MTPSDDKRQNPEGSHESEEHAVRVDVTSDEADLGNEMADGIIAEIASEMAAENKGDTTAQGSKTQAAQQKDESTVDDRLKLRERLLKTAPKETVMRAQIVKELQEKKVALEADIRDYEKRQEYHLLSTAIAQLRAVIRQLHIVAQAGYEALKEIWLKVVHKFA